jgi:hypothetical protein
LKLIETIPLQNGLTAELYDYSRLITGNRWLLGLLCKIEIPVSDEVFFLKDEWQGLKDPFTNKNGETVFFEFRKERIFIDHQNKENEFNELLRQLKEHSLRYMGHKRFPSGFLKRQIEEFEKRRRYC